MTHAAYSSAAPTRPCPRCQQANAMPAAFCGVCGASMTAAPPPPPPEDNRWRVPGGRSIPMPGASTSATEALIGAEPAAVHAGVLAVLGGWSSQGVSVAPSQPGQPIRFTREFKSFMLTGGMRVRYQGEVLLAPQTVGQTMVRVQHKVDWGSATGFLLILLVCGVYFAAMNGGGGMVLLFVLGLIGYTVWALATQKPEVWGRELLDALPPRIAMAAGGVRMDPPATPAERVWTAGPTGPAGAGQAPAAGTRESGMIEKFKVLQDLRTQGVLTAEEFERMKAELLKQL